VTPSPVSGPARGASSRIRKTGIVVLAGLAFGGAIAALGMPLADRLLAPVVKRVVATPIGRRFTAYESS